MRSEAEALLKLHGKVMARHFTANIDAGTISDIRNGAVFSFTDYAWVVMPVDERIGRFVDGPDLVC